MSNILIRIKQAVLTGRYDFARKATDEMETDELTPLDIVESIANARKIYKTIRSTSATRLHCREYLHIIQSPNLHGLQIYTKGKFVAEGGEETYYFLVSAKCCD